MAERYSVKITDQARARLEQITVYISPNLKAPFPALPGKLLNYKTPEELFDAELDRIYAA